MPYLMLLVMILGIIAFVVGMIKPRLVGGTRAKAFLISFAMALGGLVGIALTAPEPPPRAEATAPASQPASQVVAAPTPPAPVAPRPAASAPAAPPPAPAASIPELQARFVTTVLNYRERYRTGANDMVRGAERPARAQALCQFMRNGRVVDWVGTVTTLSSNNEGRGVLAVQIDRNITLQTWNIALADGSHRTLIDPQSPLFAAASALTRGARVIFSGQLMSSPDDCFHEASVTVAGAMTSPAFIFRFEAIRPAP